jgi:hypothetical protein
MTIDQRIARLEKFYKTPAGTQLIRCLDPVSGVYWSFGLGQLGMPKQFFLGKSILKAIIAAEQFHLFHKS